MCAPTLPHSRTIGHSHPPAAARAASTAQLPRVLSVDALVPRLDGGPPSQEDFRVRPSGLEQLRCYIEVHMRFIVVLRYVEVMPVPSESWVAYGLFPRVEGFRPCNVARHCQHSSLGVRTNATRRVEESCHP